MCGETAWECAKVRTHSAVPKIPHVSPLRERRLYVSLACGKKMELDSVQKGETGPTGAWNQAVQLSSGNAACQHR